jgi:hypothetical protein
LLAFSDTQSYSSSPSERKTGQDKRRKQSKERIMPIVYAAVAEDGQVTTECQLTGNRTDFSKVITVLLERMEHRNHKKSYSHEGYLLPLK